MDGRDKYFKFSSQGSWLGLLGLEENTLYQIVVMTALLLQDCHGVGTEACSK